jgi:hypothetical protein
MHGLTYQSYQKVTAGRRITRQEAEPEGMEPEHVQGGSNRLRLAVIGIVIIIVLGVSAVVLLQPTAATGLAITIDSGKVTSANSAEVALTIVLTFHNTTNKNLTYYGSSWSLSDNGAQADSGLWNDQFNHFTLAPGETRVVNENVTISLNDIVLVAPITSAGTWRLQGTATVSTIAGTNETQGFDFNFVTQ